LALFDFEGEVVRDTVNHTLVPIEPVVEVDVHLGLTLSGELDLYANKEVLVKVARNHEFVIALISKRV